MKGEAPNKHLVAWELGARIVVKRETGRMKQKVGLLWYKVARVYQHQSFDYGAGNIVS